MDHIAQKETGSLIKDIVYYDYWRVQEERSNDKKIIRKALLV